MADAPGRGKRERIGELFEHACGLSGTERAAFLAAECGSDAELHAELTSLLAAHDHAPEWLERMAADILPGALSGMSRSLWPIGQTVGRYQVEEVIGQGGMGVVYRARDMTLGRTVALKFLRPHLTDDRESRLRLETEARAASALDHPNIAVVYEIGTATAPHDPGDADRLFIAMAHYSGDTLRDRIARGPLPANEAVAYAQQVAAGLACAHDAGIVHRDIKPANVMVNERDEVKIVDFGISRTQGSDLTREGAALGTAAYMSPEQTLGGRVDHRTDVWGLGVLLYEMLTGRSPFPGSDDAVRIHAIRHDAPTPLRNLRPDCPASLGRVVERCMAKEPAARFQSAREVAAALAIEAGAAGAAPTAVPGLVPTGSRPLIGGRSPSRRLFVVGAVLATVTAVAGVVLFRGILPRAQDRLDLASVEPDRDVSHVVVFPFTAAAPDSSLERLGRDLALALATALDGIGDMRTRDPFAALTQARDRAVLSLPESRRLARELSAHRFIHGAIARSGGRLRVDAWWYEDGAAAPLARATVSADDLNALADAAAIALLDQLWQKRPPAPAGADVVMKSSVPLARRAYLDGERALQQYDMPAAIEAFERALALDSTFWWAYWRSLTPRLYTEGASGSADLIREVINRRWELPPAERLLLEATRMSQSNGERIRRLELLLTSHPDHATSWWTYANALTHYGTYLGYSIAEARSAFERALSLHPDFASAWDHLLWIALVQGDSATALRSAREAVRLDGADGVRALRLLRSSLFDSAALHPERLTEIADLLLSWPPWVAENAASAVVADGFPAKQIQLNRVIRDRGAGRTLEAALWRGEALAWAARGAWDSALVATDRWVAAGSRANADAELGAYRLAVAGVLVGGVTPQRAFARRRAAADAVSRTLGADVECRPPITSDSAQRAAVRGDTRLQCESQIRAAVYRRSDLVWLDGLLGYLARDREAIVRARGALFAGRDLPRPGGSRFVSPWDSVSRDALDRSLGALATALAGDEETAGRTLASLELEVANRQSVGQFADMHPLLAPANRLLAARLLSRSGRGAEAAPLLHWHEAVLPRAHESAWNRAIGNVTLLDRAEIAELAADSVNALRDYRRFLSWHDLPDPALRPLTERATAGIRRLSRR